MKQQLMELKRGMLSPASILAGVWSAILLCVVIGPIDYPNQPSVAVTALITSGFLLFLGGQIGGTRIFNARWRRRPPPPEPPLRVLRGAVVASALLGIVGTTLIIIDRAVLSGVSVSVYSGLLRCAPMLVDFIEIKRTALLYAGYLTFSFSFASIVLFVLKGEILRGWPAVLAQLSFLTPVAYAMLYSGRMPILLAIVLIVSAVLVRIVQGRRALPDGHYLVVKMVGMLLLFVIFTQASWSSRREFCSENFAMIEELRGRASQEDAERSRLARLEADLPKKWSPDAPRLANSISAAELNEMIKVQSSLNRADKQRHFLKEQSALSLLYEDAWNIKPRAYVRWAVDSGWLAPGTATNLLSSFFYLTHGVYVLDLVWHARSQFSAHWGVYQIGFLSPMLRYLGDQNRRVDGLNSQLKSVGIYGVFSTVWAAAFIDFGGIGAVVYILLWGFAAGWTSAGTSWSNSVTPPMLLTFILSSILLSSTQGPLGIANSALVAASILIVGLAVDFWGSRIPQR